jgi:U3 small nucleolar RNA-associated protein 4
VKKQARLQNVLAEYLNSDEVIGAHHVIFTPGSDRLIIATTDSRILVCSLLKWESGEFEVLCEFQDHRDSKSLNAKRQVGTIASMTISADGQWLATADHLNRINVFNLDSLKVCGIYGFVHLNVSVAHPRNVSFTASRKATSI